MKNQKIYFWSATILIALFEGLMPLLTSQTEMAKEGMRHLGYPLYFGNAMVVFKVLGVIALLLPQVSKRIKEWAYAGFAFDFIFAAISHGVVDGLGFQAFFPFIVLAVLTVSYVNYHNLQEENDEIA